MNVVFCTSPFQVLVAREIARYTNLEFYGMYLVMSDDPRQMIYTEKMKEYCQDVCVLQMVRDSWNWQKTILKDTKYSNKIQREILLAHILLAGFF